MKEKIKKTAKLQMEISQENNEKKDEYFLHWLERKVEYEFMNVSTTTQKGDKTK